MGRGGHFAFGNFAICRHILVALVQVPGDRTVQVAGSITFDQRTRFYQITLNRANMYESLTVRSQDFMRFAAAWATLPVNRLPEAVRNTCSPAAVRRQPASAV